MPQQPLHRTLAGIDPFDPEVIESPWGFFAALRREAPLYEMPNRAYFVISRYDDVMRAVMDTRTFSSNLVSVLLQAHSDSSPAFVDMGMTDDEASDAAGLVDVLAIADPPAHTSQRRVSNRAFTIRRVAKMEDGIRELAQELVDRFIQRGSCDWVGELAVPLPMTIIARLLGLPTGDIPQLKKWSDHSVALLSGVNTEDELVEHGIEIAGMVAYLDRQVERIRQDHTDGVISDLIRESETDNESLSRSQIISILVQLLTAGNETTTSLIGSAMLLLLRTPGLQNELRRHPELIEPFIEEALRIESPFHGHFRLVKKDTSIGGIPLPAGSRVMLLWSSANRDEHQFADAGAVDLKRRKPRGHLAFGYGIHHCIGAALARAEARIALETILRRTNRIALSPDNDFRHVKSLFVRSLKSLNIEFEQAS